MLVELYVEIKPPPGKTYNPTRTTPTVASICVGTDKTEDGPTRSRWNRHALNTAPPAKRPASRSVCRESSVRLEVRIVNGLCFDWIENGSEEALFILFDDLRFSD